MLLQGEVPLYAEVDINFQGRRGEDVFAPNGMGSGLSAMNHHR